MAVLLLEVEETIVPKFRAVVLEMVIWMSAFPPVVAETSSAQAVGDAASSAERHSPVMEKRFFLNMDQLLENIF
ncbi:hypothetical protein [Aestuariispira insulae]|uniref:hypothetical protein n=1 Tax=Aestuariispira insulae TaxID=1461337 RepID=UPI0011C06EB7|nr:hypothetical protein [Aestuariispira insulae]